MTALWALYIAACLLGAAHAGPRPAPLPAPSVTFVPGSLPPVGAGAVETIAVVVRAQPSVPRHEARVELRTPPGVRATPGARTVSLAPGRSATAFFKLTFSREMPAGARITARVNSEELGSVRVGESCDLEAVTWKARLDSAGEAEARGWASADFDDSGWQERCLPSMWNETGVTYLRTRLFVPVSWRSKPIYLRIRAVDDIDVCYMNGMEIGRTSGWDTQRSYLVDPGVIRFGQSNVLCIAVDNAAWGGGIYRSPSSFGISEEASSPAPLIRREGRAKPGPIGRPMPFRRMRVEGGVLRYEDGGEVALWGVNYYPQSWYQFENMKRLGVDMKKAIRDDLDDMTRMGVEVIRIHVFDREISDHAGNLIANEHLDLLDYLISEGSKRGIYFMFTPIAWWGGPNEKPDSFSARTPKEFMFCDEPAIAAQANYLTNWLNHKNAYTSSRYKDEPAVCALEIMNEPAYADYNTMVDPAASYYRCDPTFTKPFKDRLMKRWMAWCASNGIEPRSWFFPVFRYEILSDYLNAMYKAIRHTGAKQPVACALFDTAGKEDLIAAVADSRCEAVTTGTYAGTWDKVGDSVNYLPYTANDRLDARLGSKARLVYEFDGIKTFGAYLYPAFARKFRNLGAQICCMFQYDSSTTAEWNTDWDAHYLNWRYTPAKAVSFLIGANAFHDIPRGAAYPTVGTEQRFGKCAVSFDRNASIYSDGRACYIGAGPTALWRPLRVPEKPEMVIAVGDSPFADYSGTGAYSLKIDYAGRAAMLTVEPDAVVVGDPWHPKHDASAVVLKNETHPFRLRLPGVDVSFAARTEDGSGAMTELPVRQNTFDVSCGKYYIMW